MGSKIPGFYKLSPEERLKIVKKFANLTSDEVENLRKTGSLSIKKADMMIENVVGTMELPLGIATNFLINGKEYLIPMCIEESSVVAAASNGAKIARIRGGFRASSTEPIMIGQIQVTDLKNPEKAKKAILENKEKIISEANDRKSTIIKLGGGVKDVEARVVEFAGEKMLIVHLLIDCKDAMGANFVNTVVEDTAPLVEELTRGRVVLRILSNLATHRLARAEAVFDKKALGGEDVVDAILEAYQFACADIYRATTHNKGIMNGIEAVLLATCNDTRAVEAGAHAYASINGYHPLTTWEKNDDGDLIGKIELPLAVGIVGGATSVHPVAKTSRKILGIKSARELAEVLAAVGLAQNLAALRALATEGIQKGHMKLHARNLATMAGATGDIIDEVVEKLMKDGKPSFSKAKEIVENLKE
ncbi:MAG: hydroxymethylglutaryl-CoA reductase, degradative [Candidatus Aenigmarchaeota archaeon ex4484_14]|nr:MAG: hydroxymethylglutaryl-CoA reductase, degradative [Candidatus Aenigmarchaeota archaeon ex4484_14]